ncbi:MAG: hypothetical protein MHM6MM_001553 [Cercozoa sp. M6MM]
MESQVAVPLPTRPLFDDDVTKRIVIESRSSSVFEDNPIVLQENQNARRLLREFSLKDQLEQEDDVEYEALFSYTSPGSTSFLRRRSGASTLD